MAERIPWCGASHCPGEFAQLDAGKSKDGKKLTANVCQAGITGGCHGPKRMEIVALDISAGRKNGAKRRTPPLQVDEFGPLTQGWNPPRQMVHESNEAEEFEAPENYGHGQGKTS